MSSQFNVHGKCQIVVEDNVLIIDAEGPWNIEFMQKLHKQLQEASQQVDINNYGVLLKPYGEALAVQEAIDYHVDFLRQARTKVVAINLANSDIPSMTKLMCEKIYQQANLSAEYFTDNIAAKKWLKEQLLQ